MRNEQQMIPSLGFVIVQGASERLRNTLGAVLRDSGVGGEGWEGSLEDKQIMVM